MVSGSAHACRREAADIGKNKINLLLIPVVVIKKNLLIPVVIKWEKEQRKSCLCHQFLPLAFIWQWAKRDYIQWRWGVKFWQRRCHARSGAGGSSPTISIRREIEEWKYARRKTWDTSPGNLKDKTHKKEIRKTYVRKKGFPWKGKVFQEHWRTSSFSSLSHACRIIFFLCWHAMKY